MCVPQTSSLNVALHPCESLTLDHPPPAPAPAPHRSHIADKKVFVASAFVQWLCSNTAHAATVEEAVAIGELLVASNMVHHAVDVSNVGMVF